MGGVSPPPITPRLRDWALRALAVRAGIGGVEDSGCGFEQLGVEVAYGDQPVPAHGPVLHLPAAEPGQWARLIDGSVSSLHEVPGAPGGESAAGGELPLLFAADPDQQGFASIVEERILRVHVDLVATVVFMLGRWEETVSPRRDELGRFAARWAAASRLGFLGRPVVDDSALALQFWLRRLLPGWQPERRSFRVQLDHDIDCLRRFSPERGLLAPRGGGRTLVATLLTRGPRRAAGVLREIRASRREPRRGQAFTGIARLIELARRSGFPATFFFMAADPSARDVGYDLGGELGREALSQVRAAGMEVAFHPGFATADDRGRLEAEHRRFTEAAGTEARGARQHYLRLRIPGTWRALAGLGIAWDASLAYADAPGFRAGTCLPFRPFDLDTDEQLAIEVRPLIAMDRSFMRRDYAGTSPDTAVTAIIELAVQCRRVAGTFRLLWHNTSAHGEWGRCYEEVLGRLQALERQSG
jgi:hypothetical protein